MTITDTIINQKHYAKLRTNRGASMNSEQPFTTQNQTDSYTPSPEASLSPTVKVHGEVPPTNVYEVEAKPVVNTEVKTERQPEQPQPQPPQESSLTQR
jgi:hypothetical protein